jgi:hypothetical protein
LPVVTTLGLVRSVTHRQSPIAADDFDSKLMGPIPTDALRTNRVDPSIDADLKAVSRVRREVAV